MNVKIFALERGTVISVCVCYLQEEHCAPVSLSDAVKIYEVFRTW